MDPTSLIVMVIALLLALTVHWSNVVTRRLTIKHQAKCNELLKTAVEHSHTTAKVITDAQDKLVTVHKDLAARRRNSGLVAHKAMYPDEDPDQVPIWRGVLSMEHDSLGANTILAILGYVQAALAKNKVPVEIRTVPRYSKTAKVEINAWGLGGGDLTPLHGHSKDPLSPGTQYTAHVITASRQYRDQALACARKGVDEWANMYVQAKTTAYGTNGKHSPQSGGLLELDAATMQRLT